MSLGRREARHQTVAAARTAGVNPEDYWDFKPGQKVMTADGFAGVVAAVDDGPVAGAATYEVTLDNGMGGGQYTASLLRAMPQKKSNVDVKTAADDYPELGTILEDRPPLALSVASSLTKQAWDKDEWDERQEDHDYEPCTTCGGSGELSNGKECDDCDASGREPNRRHAALGEGDPSKYTADHKCPKCGSDRALESATGVINCEDCGYEESNPQDGYTKKTATRTCPDCRGSGWFPDPSACNDPDCPCDKTRPCPLCEGNGKLGDHEDPRPDATFHDDSDSDYTPRHAHASLGDVKKRVNDFLDMHIRSPEPKQPTPEDLKNLSVDIRALWPDQGRAKAKDHGRTAAVQPLPEPITHRLPGGATCARCGYGNVHSQSGDACLLCGGQMSKQPEKIVHALLDDPYRLLIVAAADNEFRFHVTASYADVRNKAKRIRSEGKVNIISVQGGTVVANVKGDTAVYETEIVRMGSNAIAQWHCGCKWGAYAWGRQPAFKRFEGRLCSHALALHFEAQSQGMFGRSVTEEEKTPGWLKPRTRVVVDFDRDDRKNVSRPAQPRKRDLMRTHAAVQVEESPLATLVRTALAEGVEQDEILVALAAARIDGRGFFALAAKPEGYQTTKPGSHHKDRSGDLQPCARGGCGHPEGLHGEEGGHCDSPGCDCSHFQGVGSPKEGSKKHHEAEHHVHHHHVTIHNWGRGAFPVIGYGLGWGGYGGYGGGGFGGSYAGGAGGDGDNDADDGGSGSDSDGDSDGGGSDGGGGTTAAKHAFIDTMDPTYTPGNDVRPWPDSHGAWGATTKADPSANPGSTGYASGGDPDEFKVDSSAFGRTGALWPRLALQDPWDNTLRGLNETDRPAPSMPSGNLLAPPKPGAPAPRTPGRVINLDEPRPAQPAAPAPKPVEAPHPGGGLLKNIEHGAGDAAKAVGEEAPAAENALKENPAAAAGVALVHPLVHQITHPGDWAGSGKALWNDLSQPMIPGAKTEAPAKEIADAAKGAYHGAEDAFNWVHDHTPSQKAHDSIVNGWHSLFGGGDAKPQPKAFQPPAKPVPMTPGHGAPVAPTPQTPGVPQPQLQRAPAGAPQSRTRTLLPGAPANAPNKVPQPADGGQKPGPNKSEPKDDGKSRFPKPKFLLPPLPYTPDYYRSSNTNISDHGIGSRASLVASLLAEEASLLDREAALTPQQEFANGVADNLEALGGPSLPRYLTLDRAREAAGDGDLAAITQQEGIKERNHGAIDLEATLHDEPEAALPRTDGMDEDPDGDVEGLASHGSVESVDEIVARFQATAGAAVLAGGGSTGPGEGGESDVAMAAKAFLQTEAMKTFSPAEQRSIIDEGMDVTAANLDRLDITGTHYEPLEAALASQTDDDDLELA